MGVLGFINVYFEFIRTTILNVYSSTIVNKNGLDSAKNTFLMNFQLKLINFEMVLNLVDVHRYHLPTKNSLQNSTHNLSFEIYLQCFVFCDVDFFNTNLLHMFKFENVCWSFF